MSERKFRREFTPITPGDAGWEDLEDAEDILFSLFYEIKSCFHVLIPALNALKPVAVRESIDGFATDGIRLFYDPKSLVRDQNINVRMERIRSIVHILYHGLLGHFEDGPKFINRKLSWEVMDIEVERLMTATGFSIEDQYEDWQYALLDDYLDDDLFIGYSLYYEALRDKRLRNDIHDYICNNVWFHQDDHSAWALPKRKPLKITVEISKDGGGGEKDGGKGMSVSKFWKNIRLLVLKEADGEDGNKDKDGNKDNGGRVSVSVGRNLADQYNEEKQQNAYGTGRGGQSLKAQALPGTPESYRDMLNEFIHLAEVGKEEDNPDPILYSYGLSLYGDVPIIEPMDVIERPRLNNIVLAVDVSGSCDTYASLFLTQTLGLFEDISSIADIEGLSYLECDTEIQAEKQFESADELEDMETSHCFYGYGGTDFRPVFERADAMQENGQTVDALIYLTDACGDFPDTEPQYPVYFVIPKEEYNEGLRRFVPDWVNMKLLEDPDNRRRPGW